MKALHDPLVHFLVIGGILFGLFSLTDAEGEHAPAEIVVTAGQIASLKALFARTWQRQPTSKETEHLVGEYIRDEILYREAVAIGLDKDDAIVRRRMRQKMEFVANVVAETEPTEAELHAYVAEHEEWFRSEPRYAFSHVYFSAENEDAPTRPELRASVQALNNAGADATELGDAFIPGVEFKDVGRSVVDELFGESFARSLDAAPLGRWTGPVSSAYGAHLVRLSARVDAASSPFEQIRQVARREWLNERRITASDALYESLRARYSIRIDETAVLSSDQVAQESP